MYKYIHLCRCMCVWVGCVFVGGEGGRGSQAGRGIGRGVSRWNVREQVGVWGGGKGGRG